MVITMAVLLTVLLASPPQAENIPGTHINVDWPSLISGQDVTLTSPPADMLNGLLLGNGDIGISVYGPPELLTIHVGKNDIWDYRDSIETKSLRTHKQFLDLYTDTARPPMGTGYLTANNDPWNQEIRQAFIEPSPSIKPAGQIRFRNSALQGASYSGRLSLWNAEAAVEVGKPGAESLRSFVCYPRNLIVVEYTPTGAQQFDIELARHQDSTGMIPNAPEFGASGRDMWVRYRFPADQNNYPQGFEYVMYARVLGGETVTTETRPEFATITQWVWEKGAPQTTEGAAIAHVSSDSPVRLLVSVMTTRDGSDPFKRAKSEVEAADTSGIKALREEHQAFWHDYWKRSFVQLPAKPYLMKHWYFSQYLLACSWREGRIAPGLFGAWTWEDFPGFGNDYHWDYNMQQAIWGAFSSNHLEQAAPYDDAVLALLPTAMKEARDNYSLDGAKFFLVSYPRKYVQNPFPLVHYDQMMSVNVWVAHPLWWRYLYSQDTEYLRTRAYPLMRECAMFYEGFVTRAADGKYDIWPTAVWDVYLSEYLAQNRNCNMDLSFVRYLMNACVEASTILGVDADKRPKWREIVDNLREYPKASTPEGDVFAPFEGTGPNDYLFPTTTMAVFPGEDIGLHSPRELQDIALRTARRDSFMGAGEQLLKVMARVRLGCNELDAYEAVTKATTLPNMGWKIHGWDRNFWVHQCGFPIVINDSILQSYTGDLRTAPVPLRQDVRFGRIRAVGAFLVSGEIRADGRAAYLAIESLAGKQCRVIRPWDDAKPVRIRKLSTMKTVDFLMENGVLVFDTSKGETYIIDCPSDPWEDQPDAAVTGARVEDPGIENAAPSHLE